MSREINRTRRDFAFAREDTERWRGAERRDEEGMARRRKRARRLTGTRGNFLKLAKCRRSEFRGSL